MKIQTVSAFKRAPIKPNCNKINLSSKSDSISFKSRLLAQDEVNNENNAAFEIVNTAQNLYNKAQNQVSIAYELLGNSKQFEKESKEFLELVKTNPKQVLIKLSDGRFIQKMIKLEGDSLFLDINLYSSSANLERQIRTKNGKIKAISFKNEKNEKCDIIYGNDNITYMQNVKKQSNGTLCADFSYVFIDDSLASIKEKATFTSWIQRCSKYSYFKDDKLALCALRDFVTLPEISNRQEHRYIFDNQGNLINYLYDYSSSAKNRLSWRDGYHFDCAKFIAHTHKTLQPILNEPLEMYDCIYLKNGRYYQDTTKHCVYEDFETIEIL